MKLKVLFLLLLPLFSLLNENISYAQFGKNKVQYKEFNWQYIQTAHFDIYFHQGGKYLTEFTAQVAESSLASLNRNFDYILSNRVPIVIFNSHNEFQQNNIVDEYLPEGVGGVTELFKNRIVIPFEGDYEKFRHVIHHELVHAYMNDMFYGGSIQNIISKNISLVFPGWFSEGMAEVQSLNGLDKATDMFIRDAVINNYLPPLEYNGGYLAYRGGQTFFAFLQSYYGEDKIGELMNNIKALGDVDAGFYETYKLGIEDLDKKWQKELKKTYWPGIKSREEPTDFAKRLTDNSVDGGFYNIAPALSPDGRYFAFISDRNDLFDVYIANARTGEIIDKIVEGNTTPEFEELQILAPGLTWSPDGRRIALSTKAGANDAIFILNVNSGDRTEVPITNLNELQSVSWSPAGNKLAFIGMNNKQSDLYVYDLDLRIQNKLTDDVFSDANPTWTPDGRFIYFTSDRKDYLNAADIPADFKMADFDYSNSDIYKIDVNTRQITRETNIPHSKQSYAQLSPDGRKMIYVSDMNGISNLYMREYDSAGTHQDRPITNSLNPVEQISVSKDGKRLLFSSLFNGGYNIFSLSNPFERDIKVEKLEPTEFVKSKILAGDYPGLAALYSVTPDSLDGEVNNDSTLFAIDSVKGLAGDDEDTLTNGTDTSSVYGNDIKIDFNNRDTLTSSRYLDSLYRNNKNFQVTGNTNPDGSYTIKDYKVKFSPDLVYGNANYSSFYGVQGVAQIALSDLMGNHRIYILTSMVIDLKNSDYAVAYYYLPKRLDLGAELYHTARFILYDRNDGNGELLYRYRNYGANLNASYPISRFKRIDGNFSLMHITQENLDIETEPTSSKTLIVPSLSLVHDNTLFGYTSPIRGTRYNLQLLGSPKLGSEGLGFTSVLGDFRTYFKLGDGYTFAFRLAGGASFGPNPQRFYIGGVSNWINREFENRNIPINSIEEYAFSTPGLPLRGFNYDRMSGSKYALTNLELRFPVFRYLILGLLPIGFQNVEGVAFVDAGTAWKNNDALKLFVNDGSGVRTNDLLLGMGFGTRLNFLNFPVMFDVAWSYNLQKFSKPKYYISLGYDF
jgi:Tol biopolymer transport system component